MENAAWFVIHFANRVPDETGVYEAPPLPTNVVKLESEYHPSKTKFVRVGVGRVNAAFPDVYVALAVPLPPVALL